MAWTIRAENFRGLRLVEWSPRGVCALVGPNGSGKSTLVRIPAMMRRAADDFAAAIDQTGGRWGLRRLGTQPEERTRVEVEQDGFSWAMLFPVHPGPGALIPGEEILTQGKALARREPGASNGVHCDGSGILCEGRSLIRCGGAPETDRPARQLLDSLARSLYGEYVHARLREHGSQAEDQFPLRGDGSNVFAVLHGLHSRREGRPQYEFILEGLKSAFPDEILDVDFVVAGRTVWLQVYKSGRAEPFPIESAPNGLLAALIHLTAIAAAPQGALVAIDEFENSLHPFAIRRLLAHIRERAEKNDLTVLLATHSPVLIEEFREDPSRVFVMEPGQEVLPVPLDDLEDREWLAHFSLGDLYARQEFGSPTSERAGTAPE